MKRAATIRKFEIGLRVLFLDKRKLVSVHEQFMNSHEQGAVHEQEPAEAELCEMR